MNMFDSLILFVSASFWVWVAVIISIFIKVAKAKLDTAFHGQSYACFLGYGSTKKGLTLYPWLPFYFLKNLPFLKRISMILNASRGSQKFH
jgi:hypothetical protein